MSLLTPMNDVDSTKLTAQATEIRKSQPQHDHTSAMDMRIQLRNLEERRDHHASRVRELEGLLKEQGAKWKDLKNALKAAEAMVGVRPQLRIDIAVLKEKITKNEEQGADIKRNLTINRNIVNGTQKHLDEFDYAKLEKLSKQDDALKKVGL